MGAGQVEIGHADLVKGFQVIVDEGQRHEHQMAHPLPGQLGDDLVGIGFQPLRRPDPALKGQLEAPPGETPAEGLQGAVQFIQVRVPAAHIGLRKAVGGAEDHRRFRRRPGRCQHRFQAVGHGIEVSWRVGIGAVGRQASIPSGGGQQAMELLERRSAAGITEMGIERQGQYGVHGTLPVQGHHLVNRGLGMARQVAVGDHQRWGRFSGSGPQRLDQGRGDPPGGLDQWRTAPDLPVLPRNFNHAAADDEPGQYILHPTRRGQLNRIGIAQNFVEEIWHLVQIAGTAKIEQHHHPTLRFYWVQGGGWIHVETAESSPAEARGGNQK